MKYKIIVIVISIMLLHVECKSVEGQNWSELRNALINTKYFTSPPSVEYIFNEKNILLIIGRRTRGEVSYKKNEWIIDEKKGTIELVFYNNESVRRLVYKSFEIEKKEGEIVIILSKSNNFVKPEDAFLDTNYLYLYSGLLGEIPTNEPK